MQKVVDAYAIIHDGESDSVVPPDHFGAPAPALQQEIVTGLREMHEQSRRGDADGG